MGLVGSEGGNSNGSYSARLPRGSTDVNNEKHQPLSKPLKHQLIFFVVAVIVVFNTFMPSWIFLSMPRIPWEVHPSEQV